MLLTVGALKLKTLALEKISRVLYTLTFLKEFLTSCIWVSRGFYSFSFVCPASNLAVRESWPFLELCFVFSFWKFPGVCALRLAFISLFKV